MDINEIARMAGVSRATVSRYLNDGYVSEEKRHMIKKVIDETGYVPSQRAQTLRTGKTKLVGVIIPKISSDSVSRMVQGMTKLFRENGYQIILANTDNDAKAEVDYIKLFSGRNKVDGIILIATVFSAAHIRALEACSIPTVVLGQKLEGQSCVFQDDFLFPYTYEKLAELADAVGITGQSKREKAKKFIAEIRAMEDRMDIPYGFDCIRDEDIPLIAERCIKETNPTYPVPHIFTKEDLEVFIKEHLQIKN